MKSQEQWLEHKDLLMRSYDDIASGKEPTEFINYELAQGKSLSEITKQIEKDRIWIMATVIQSLPWYKRLSYKILGIIRLPYVLLKRLLKN